MTEEKQVDLAILGGGQAGIPLAWAAAGAGQSVILVERKQLGGSCVNFGCTPTKAAIASAKVAHMARRAADFGIRVSNVEIDYGAVLARARGVAAESRHSLDKGLENSTNPQLIRAHGRLAGREGDRFRVAAGEQKLLARQVVLNTGNRTQVPELPGLHAIPFLHAGNWLEPHAKPSHVVILGGGYIAVEMAQFYRRMACEVTVLVRSGEILKKEDADVAEALRGFLAREGVRFRMHARVESLHRQGDGLIVKLGDGHLEASHLFIATGRTPNTDDLGLDTIGLSTRDDGTIEADKRLASKVPGVWIAGDIRGGPLFTHTSWDDYRILFSQLCADGKRTTDRVVPYAIFTDPELGRVGLTETEAASSGRKILTGRFEMKKNGKARELGEDDGFIKVIADAGTSEFLGATVLAAQGSELVHLFIDLMNARAPYQVMRDAVHIHPTLSEAVQSAVSALANKSIGP